MRPWQDPCALGCVLRAFCLDAGLSLQSTHNSAMTATDAKFTYLTSFPLTARTLVAIWRLLVPAWRGPDSAWNPNGVR